MADGGGNERVLLVPLSPSRRLYSLARRMTPLQSAFADEFLIDLDPEAAAERIGRPAKEGHRLKRNALVQEAIQIAMAQRSQRMEISQDNVLQELSKIAFSSLGDFMQETADGEPYIDMRRLTADQKAAIKTLHVHDYLDGRGEGAREVRRVDFELHSKMDALKLLGQHLGMFVQRVDVRGTLEQRIDGMDRETRLERMRELLTLMMPHLEELDSELIDGEAIEVAEDAKK